MKNRAYSLALILSSTLFFSLSACSGDDSDTQPTGTGGSAGTGGSNTGATGGSGGSAGSQTGGSSGTSGSAGSGGSGAIAGNGGTDGIAGTAGNGGTGGISGSAGTGGSIGGSGGIAGTAGQSGSSGTGGSGGSGGALCADRTGGALITFDIVGQSFTVWITNSTFIDAAITQTQTGMYQLPVFNTVLAGMDCDPQWDFHVDPEQVGFADFAIELCDGTPQYVNENLAEWMSTVVEYCPWAGQVQSVDDRRQ